MDLFDKANEVMWHRDELPHLVVGKSIPAWDCVAAIRWCKKELEGHFYINFGEANFELEKDAAYFTLKWL